MAITIQISGEHMGLIVYGDHPDYSVLEERIIEANRWDYLVDCIVHKRSDNTNWHVNFHKPATEYQDVPIEELGPYVFTQVERKPVERLEWVVV